MLLRRHYGMSATEALYVTPVWEIELLLAALPDDDDR